MVSTSEVEGLGDSGDCITVCVHANVFVHNYFCCSYYECIFYCNHHSSLFYYLEFVGGLETFLKNLFGV